MSFNIPNILSNYLREYPSATSQEVINFLDKEAKGLLQRGRVQESAELFHHMMDRLQAEGSHLDKLLARTSATVRLNKAPASMSAGTIASDPMSLPRGTRFGKAPAIIAGVGLVGAGAYALFRSWENEQNTRWVARVEQQRSRPRTTVITP